jgi:hypothetical protein
MAVYRLYHNQQDNRWYLKYIQIKPFTVKQVPVKPPGSGKLIIRRSEEQDNTTILLFI